MIYECFGSISFINQPLFCKHMSDAELRKKFNTTLSHSIYLGKFIIPKNNTPEETVREFFDDLQKESLEGKLHAKIGDNKIPVGLFVYHIGGEEFSQITTEKFCRDFVNSFLNFIEHYSGHASSERYQKLSKYAKENFEKILGNTVFNKPKPAMDKNHKFIINVSELMTALFSKEINITEDAPLIFPVINLQFPEPVYSTDRNKVIDILQTYSTKKGEKVNGQDITDFEKKVVKASQIMLGELTGFANCFEHRAFLCAPTYFLEGLNTKHNEEYSWTKSWFGHYEIIEDINGKTFNSLKL